MASRAPAHFNSRPCERGDGMDRRRDGGRNYFNSRPCERGDTRSLPRSSAAANFNSRPCERGDAERPMYVRLFEPISIPAPARGATPSPTCRPCTPCHFNSRPCERGDYDGGKGYS